jgi:TolB-like protein
MSDRIGHYRIVREIGRGGMGVVYEAIDERLERSVALKTVLQSSDPVTRDRFLREARAAAAVSHPHICQLFEIGDHHGDPFLAMELLEGESLAERLEAGPLAPDEAIAVTISMLSALDALHRRSIVHRDLKPSNVFLTPHAVKLLDFGLARPLALAAETGGLTRPGIVMGTPRYMAPEQARGGEVDARTDLFSTGAVLFEMLSGRPAFDGSSAIEALHAVLHDQPPALVGSLAVIGADRVIQRALAKTPAERYQTAEEMIQDLRACQSGGELSSAAVVRAATRLIVLPFRLLRPDPAIEFLAFSLPDAITVSLSGLESLVVRSSLAGSKFGEGVLDLRALASDAAVDAAVTGTLMSGGGLVRVSVQLIAVPSGTVLWSHAWQVPVDDLFQVQDAVCSAVVEALSLPLSSREQKLLHHDVPGSADAYAHYLRGNRLSTQPSQWQFALESYRHAVEADPSYAPAWARLGRCLRIMGKYSAGPDAARHRDEAQSAFERAFRINPELSVAHNLYTYQEVDRGRALEAVLRLLGRVRQRTSDPELYSGLVHACRYVGLLDASVAAFHRARRLDPSIQTTVMHTLFMNGDFDQAIAHDTNDPRYLTGFALLMLGRREEAAAHCRAAIPQSGGYVSLGPLLEALVAIAEGDMATGRAAVARLLTFPAFSDPEGWFYWANCLALLGDLDGALDPLERAVNGGWHCVRGLEIMPALEPLRDEPRFVTILKRTRADRETAARAFGEAGGHRLLGLSRS